MNIKQIFEHKKEFFTQFVGLVSLLVIVSVCYAVGMLLPEFANTLAPMTKKVALNAPFQQIAVGGVLLISCVMYLTMAVASIALIYNVVHGLGRLTLVAVKHD